MTIHTFVQLMGVTRNRIEPVNQGMGLVLPESGQNYTLAIILALALVVSLAVAAFILLRKTSQQTINDPVKLFSELCRGHGLSRSQRNALIDLANKRNLKDPSLVLLDSSYWVLDPNIDQELCQPKSRNRLVMVQRLLFNSDTPAVQSKLSS
jgi:hypothetical protein